MRIEGASVQRRAGIDDCLRVGQERIPVGGRFIGKTRLVGDIGIVGLDNDVEQEGPRVQFAVNGTLFADGG